MQDELILCQSTVRHDVARHIRENESSGCCGRAIQEPDDTMNVGRFCLLDPYGNTSHKKDKELL